ncbi:MAG: hypothetical protein RL693_1926 [Verrucomicrobiota bacterium]|jgi:hypothetical protein
MIEPADKPSHDPDFPQRNWLYLSLILGLLLLLILASYPGYLWWKKHRLHGLIDQAQVHINNEQWEQAYKILSQAYAQSQTNPELIQKIARLTQRTNPDPSQALFFWKQLVAYGSPTTEDLADMGRSFLADGQPEEALKILHAFSTEQRTTRSSIDLEAELLYYQGKTIEADSLRRKFLQRNPHDPGNELSLAILDLSNPYPEVQKSAFETLWKIARARNRQSAEALQAIAKSPLLTPGNSPELVKLASENDRIPAGRYYDILHQHLLLNPKKRDEIFTTETIKHRGKSIQESTIFYRWLLQEREYDRVLELVPKEKATLNEVLFPVFVEALAGKSRWAELNVIFRSAPTIPLSPMDQSVLQARIAHGQRDKDEIVSGHLKEAGRRAIIAKNLEAILRIVTIADELGFDDVAIETLSKAAAIPQFQVEMLERLLGIYASHGDAESMLATTQSILEAKPAMRSHLEVSLYLKLLLGKEIESITQNASSLATQGRVSPEASLFLSALSAYRFKNIERMKEQLAKVEPNGLPPGQRAVYSGMLATCGEQAQAYMLAEKIAPALLLESELIFLRKAL